MEKWTHLSHIIIKDSDDKSDMLNRRESCITISQANNVAQGVLGLWAILRIPGRIAIPKFTMGVIVVQQLGLWTLDS